MNKLKKTLIGIEEGLYNCYGNFLLWQTIIETEDVKKREYFPEMLEMFYEWLNS